RRHRPAREHVPARARVRRIRRGRGPRPSDAWARSGGSDRACADRRRDGPRFHRPLEGAIQGGRVVNINASLIISIVRKGWGSSVLQASVKAGARGGTVLLGRGAGVHEKEKIFGVSIEPEKEIVLTLVQVDQVDAILGEIVRAADLEAAGRGMAFVLPVNQVVGITDSLLGATEG